MSPPRRAKKRGDVAQLATWVPRTLLDAARKKAEANGEKLRALVGRALANELTPKQADDEDDGPGGGG
jgi:hypothetical protein